MKKILFVCTGNTCRSKMAEVIATTLSKQRGLKGVKFYSAGLNIVPDSFTTAEAINALASLGYKAKSTSATQFTLPMIKKYDRIITMTPYQKAALPPLDKISSLYPSIVDPYGEDESFYIECAKQLTYCIEKLIIELGETK